MKIKQIISQHAPAVAETFSRFNIDQPVNRATLAAAIALHKQPSGNALLDDLMAEIGDSSNYSGAHLDQYTEDLLGLGKKGKEKRQTKREELGGYSKAGAIIRKIGIAKNRPAQAGKAGFTASEITNKKPPIVDDAENPDPKAPAKGTFIDKLGGVLNTVAGVAGQAAGIADSLRGGGDGGGDTGTGADTDGGNDQAGGGFKKFLPWIIGGAVLVVGGIIIWAMSRGKSKK